MTLESNWETVEGFVDRLKKSLTEEMAIIRETQLDLMGGFRRARLKASSYDMAHTLSDKEVFVDRLGRVLLPARAPYDDVEFVAIEGGPLQEIVRREPRYEGEKQVAWVCYLEGGDPHAD